MNRCRPHVLGGRVGAWTRTSQVDRIGLKFFELLVVMVMVASFGRLRISLLMSLSSKVLKHGKNIFEAVILVVIKQVSIAKTVTIFVCVFFLVRIVRQGQSIKVLLEGL